MKIGVRKPSVKKSVAARTTGKLNRKVKNTINPLYNKKGMGYINNPKKAVYNKVYNKTSVSFVDNIKPSSKDGIIVTFFKIIVYMYYLIFKYLLYVPIQYIVKKSKR